MQRIVIIGGGLAGLTAAIHLASAGHKPILFEKNKYPHHKVCGEYLSKEIQPYLLSLGIDLDSLNPAHINKLVYTTPSGKLINAALPLGGIGISRFTLDYFMAEIAKERGVSIIQEAVTDIVYENGSHTIKTENTTLTADIVLGAYGKRSLLDKKLERPFIERKNGWLAVKAHYKASGFPKEVVFLHNFNGGYCGLSKTESGDINVCYLATYNSFKRYKNPQDYKEQVLCRNKHLAEFFELATPVFERDLTIAQISFEDKSRIKNHVLMLGDAAALIHPLCGNGMAMAIHSGKLAAEILTDQLSRARLDRSKLENVYSSNWNKIFLSRIKTGRILQKILLNPAMAEVSQSVIRGFPGLLPQIIKRTHGTTVI